MHAGDSSRTRSAARKGTHATIRACVSSSSARRGSTSAIHATCRCAIRRISSSVRRLAASAATRTSAAVAKSHPTLRAPSRRTAPPESAPPESAPDESAPDERSISSLVPSPEMVKFPPSLFSPVASERHVSIASSSSRSPRGRLPCASSRIARACHRELRLHASLTTSASYGGGTRDFDPGRTSKAPARDVRYRSSASHSPHSAQSARHTVFTSNPGAFVRCAERYVDSARFARRSVARNVEPPGARDTFGAV